jgi:phenylacetate-CoA ligase
MSLQEKIYYRLPAVLQNAAVSFEGWKLKTLRYGRQADQVLAALLQSQRLDAAALEQRQREELLRLVRHCYAHVPYYTALFDRAGIAPDRIDSIAALKTIPMLEKEVLRSRPGDLVARNFARTDLVANYTSGTSGTPLTIFQDRRAVTLYWAFVERFRRWAGVRIGERRVTFGGRILTRGTRAPFWRYNLPGKQLLCSSYHLSPATLPAYVRRIRAFDPVFIDGYPSAISTLAKFVLEQGITGIRPRAVLTTAETLYPWQREVIEQAFGTTVFDQYGSTEMAGFICQCEKGTYHINSDFGIVEILDAAGREVGPGQAGELVLTGFVNDAMPLLRYRIGDRAVRAAAACACGRAFPSIASIEGRTDEVLVTRERGYIGRLDPAFKKLRGIREAQIVQKDIDTFVVNVVPGDGYDEAVETRLVAALKDRLGAAIRLNVKRVADLPVGKHGKFRAVISELTYEQRKSYGLHQ